MRCASRGPREHRLLLRVQADLGEEIQRATHLYGCRGSVAPLAAERNVTQERKERELPRLGFESRRLNLAGLPVSSRLQVIALRDTRDKRASLEPYSAHQLLSLSLWSSLW
ncbi:unnamed protein product [Hapterophycus canaliculatus]